ncbi:MAG: peptide deformylase [Clostridiales bacterium]|nr:peptide deformylase [Clostridiales bacterium]
MAVRKIFTRGERVLEKTAHKVTRFDDRLHVLLDDMRDTLIDSGGLGLAAPQIGILRRVVVLFHDEEEILELVNPSIVSAEGEQDGFEGCLSVPGLYGKVKRPMRVRVRAQDRFGTFFEVEDDRITARCFCHELEHLDGRLFVRHADKLYTAEELDELLEQAGEDGGDLQ